MDFPIIIDVSAMREPFTAQFQKMGLEAEVARFRKLFDDAGQGEHNVLALVDHYQECVIEADDRAAGAQARIAELEEQVAALKADCLGACKCGGFGRGAWSPFFCVWVFSRRRRERPSSTTSERPTFTCSRVARRSRVGPIARTTDGLFGAFLRAAVGAGLRWQNDQQRRACGTATGIV
jgi:hypothetical protein